jgi:hypothetical protein
MEVVYYAQSVLSVVLQVVLLFFLLQGSVRRYFILFLYSIVYLVTSLVEVLVFRSGGKESPLYTRVYWTDEIVLDLLLFLMVIVLTYRATEGSPLRGAVGKILTVVVVAALALPFILIQGPIFSGSWFNVTSQFLNFGGLILNLALWSALIGSKRRDTQLLTVSAGLGVSVAGAAITYGVRHWLHPGPLMQAVDIFGVIAHIAGVAIWCWAFRPAARARSEQAAALTGSA